MWKQIKIITTNHISSIKIKWGVVRTKIINLLNIPNNRSQIIATKKGIRTNAFYVFAESNGVQTAAIRESKISNACYTIGNCYGGQAAAIRESTASYACDAVGNGYGGQTAASRESLVSNVCDAVGNGNGCQTAATFESIVSDACDTVFDDDGFNGTARGIPWCIGIRGVIRHCSGAGDGEGTIAEVPREVGAAGAGLGEEGSYAGGKSKEES